MACFGKSCLAFCHNIKRFSCAHEVPLTYGIGCMRRIVLTARDVFTELAFAAVVFIALIIAAGILCIGVVFIRRLKKLESLTSILSA